MPVAERPDAAHEPDLNNMPDTLLTDPDAGLQWEYDESQAAIDGSWIDPVLEKEHWADPLLDELIGWYSQSDSGDAGQLTLPLLRRITRELNQKLEQGNTALSLSDIDELLAGGVLPPHPLISTDPAGSPAPLVLVNRKLYWYRQWQDEQQLAGSLASVNVVPNSPPPLMPRFAAQDRHINDRQRQAITVALQQGLSIITGGPGTGKTFTLAHVVRKLLEQAPDLRIGLAAPTGKAAQRMQASIQQQFSDQPQLIERLPAMTVHRLLGLGNGAAPFYHQGRPLPYDLLVIDEASMLDLGLARHLLQAVVPGTRLILLGDAHQLTSVEAGTVLHDLVTAPTLQHQVVQLAESKRFSPERGIGQLAALMLEGQAQSTAQVQQLIKQNADELSFELLPPVTGRNPGQSRQQQQSVQQQEQMALTAIHEQLWRGYARYQELLQEGAGFSELMPAFDTFRILTATRDGRLGVHAINQALSRRLLQMSRRTAVNGWFHGRPVLITQNDYTLGLSNGDIGLCLRNDDGLFEVHFAQRELPIPVNRLPPAQLESAFALTIHKSQGSEFDRVALLLDEQAGSLLTRELVYTGLTRAKTHVSIYSQWETLMMGINRQTRRVSGLAEKL